MKKAKDVILTVLGVLAAATGLLLLRKIPDLRSFQALPYLLIGVGCGAFGHGTGNLLSRRAMRQDPALQKQQEIEHNDERNRAIADKAKGRAYDRMIFVFGALLPSFALMGVDTAAVLLLVAAYLFVIGSSVYYRIKYQSEM